MNVVALLLEFAVALEREGIPGEVAKLISLGLTSLIEEIQRIQLEPTEAGVMMEIIKGLDSDPDWFGATGDEKHQAARDAAASYLKHHGKDFSDAAIDTAIQLGYNAMKAAG